MAGITFQLIKYVPSIGAPDYALLKAVTSGNYATGVGGTTVDLTPSTFADPNGVGVLGEPTNQPVEPPSIEDCALAGGVYAQLTPGATLNANKIVLWTNNNAELGNVAYPAGTLIVKLPLR